MRHEVKTVRFESKTKTKAVTLKTKTVKVLSRDSLEMRQCLEASLHPVFSISFKFMCQTVKLRVTFFLDASNEFSVF